MRFGGDIGFDGTKDMVGLKMNSLESALGKKLRKMEEYLFTMTQN